MREHEILRVLGSINGRDPCELAQNARREILVWAQRRSGGRFPDEAWALRDFESLSGGRTSVGVRIVEAQTDIWAIRADDPDKSIAGRVWTTEAAVVVDGHFVQFSLRLLASTAENAPDIEPHTPGFVQQIADRCGLRRGPYDLDAAPRQILDSAEANGLVDMLVNPARQLPVFVLTVPEVASAASSPLLDAPALARAVLGLAHVVVVPANFTWALTTRLGRLRSVFGGAVRVYLPGFAEDANPYEHRLILADRLGSDKEVARCSVELRSFAAQASLRRTRLGVDILPFAALRSESLQFAQRRIDREGASDSERLQLTNGQVEALKKQLDDEQKSLEFFSDEHGKAIERAEFAEAQLHAAQYRIQQLSDQIKSRGDNLDARAVSLLTESRAIPESVEV